MINKRMFCSVLSIASLGCSVAYAAPNKKPNIIFLMTDQWRKQSIGMLNEDPVSTPNLDKLGEECAVFYNATSANPVSGPNRACLMTGQYTWNNGLWANEASADPNGPSLGLSCKAAGYATGFIGKWHLNGVVDNVYDKSRRHGWDFWYQSIGHRPFEQPYVIGDATKPVSQYDKWAPTIETDQAIKFMDANKNQPFALTVSYNPPHQGGGVHFEERYIPGKRRGNGARTYGSSFVGPEKYEKPYMGKDYNADNFRKNLDLDFEYKISKYDEPDDFSTAAAGYMGSITSIDHEMGRIIDYLKANDLYDNTIIVITSDHGEMLCSHGVTGKSRWHEESIGVPLFVEFGDKIDRGLYGNPFNSIDVLPTILSLSGIDIPKEVDGFSFANNLKRGNMKGAPEYSFIEFNCGGIKEKAPRYWRGVYSSRYTYVVIGRNRYRADVDGAAIVLYDREKDPYQMNPIQRGKSAQYDKQMDKMHAALVKHLLEISDEYLTYYDDPKAILPTPNKTNFDPNAKKK